MKESLSDRQIALQSQLVLDIPARIKYLLIIAGVIGAIIVVMEGLISGRPSAVGLDKIVHFAGYTIISTVLVLGLRPIIMIPALLSLLGVSVAAEFIQEMFGRSFEVKDMIANGLGVSFGLVLGLSIRFTYGFIKKELALSNIRKNLMKFNKDDLILKQDEPLSKFYLIKKGSVTVYRTINGTRENMGILKPGDTIGAIGLILEHNQYSDVVANEPTEIYGMDLGELMDSAGGKQLPVSLLLTQAAEYIVKSHEENIKLKQNIDKKEI